MHFETELRDELRRLTKLRDPVRRGRRLDPLVARVMERASFKVYPNAGVARPRQTDVMAQDGRDWYLIEAKWTEAPADIDATASLFDRLTRAARSQLVGVMVSMSGFTDGAIEDVEARRAQHPILLVEGPEFDHAVEDVTEIRRLLRRKHAALVADGRVLLASRTPVTAVAPVQTAAPLKRSPAVFLTDDGRETQWIAAPGEFSGFTFVRDLPDIDWVTSGGLGVSFDLSLPVEGVDALEIVLQTLSRLGHTTSSGHWSIQQATTNWHGMGAAALIDALHQWKRRFRALETVHHTEDVLYADEYDGGFYTLHAGVQSSEPRHVWRPELSFQLRGIPLDVGPIRHLCEALGAEGEPYFRPRDEKSVKTARLRARTPMRVRPTTLIVEPERNARAPFDKWVVGIVVPNPYKSASRKQPKALDEDVPIALMETGVLVCDLRSHHPLSEPPDSYHLVDAEWAWSSDGLVLRIRADWDKSSMGFVAPRRS